MDCTCAHCTRQFPVVASRVATAKYCSRACKDAARQHQIQQVCPSCENVFSAKVSDNQRYCSHTCAYRDRTARLRALSTDEQALLLRYESLVASVARGL